MAVDTTITSADNTLAPDTSGILAMIGPSELGTVGLVYQLSPGQEPYDTLGGGQLSEDAAFELDQGATIVAVPATTTAGSIGTVSHEDAAGDGPGTGPSITVTGTPLIDLPLFIAKIKTGGDRDGGAAIISIAFDGSTYVLDIPIPPAPQAVLIGTVDLTGLTLSTLNAETLKITPDDHAQITVTFTAPTSVADVIDQINTQLTSGGTAARAILYQGKFLKLYSATHGTGSTLAVDATSTADTTLGISNTPAAGANATTSLPYTGLTLTFASGTYVVNETYAAPIVGLSCSQTAILAACDALRDSGVPFGQLLITQPPADGAALRALVDAVTSKVNGWGSGAEAIWVDVIVASPLGATGSTGIQTNDNDVKAAMLGQVDKTILVAHGDAYVAGHRIQGEHRASIARAVAARLATQRLSQDPGYGAAGALPGVNMTGPDGVARARNEATAVVKMGGSTGPGFTVLTTKRGDPYVVHGVTRAGQASRYVHVGVLRMAYRVAQVLFGYAQTVENWDPFLSGNGTIRQSDGDTLAGAAYEVVAEAVLRAPNQHASDAIVDVDRTEVVANTDHLTFTAEVQMRGQAENISLKITTTGILTLPDQAA
ncbi:MAG TPA: hypothetical protein VGQ38_15340 [Gaiellaceae bacterium]|jgi:hypothetical protein|nr:hypothetical protein [Gaiellaceae bacterium]